MRKKIQVKLNCGDCKQNFSNLKNLNQHIVKTGCHNGIPLQKLKLALILGIKKYTVSIPS